MGEFDDDIGEFFDTDEAATPAILRYKKSGEEIPVSIIFDKSTTGVDVVSQQLATFSPQATIETVLAPDVAKGDTLKVGSTTYNIIAPPETDGAGLTVLTLSED